MNLWEEFVGVSYVFLFFVVREDDPIGFFWLLYWYLLHIVNIVVGGFQCCLILYL